MRANRLPEPPLLLITDRGMARRPLPEIVAAALEGGCRWVMVREKDLAPAALAALVASIVALAQPYGATVSVNGAAALAVACGSYAAHLPQGQDVALARQQLGRHGLLGVSAHSPAEAQRAATAGADYVTLSPIFPTTSKPGYGPALGLAELRRVAAALPIPVLALGGITPATIGACRAAGAAGIAVMGAMMQADDPRLLMQQFLTEKENREPSLP